MPYADKTVAGGFPAVGYGRVSTRRQLEEGMSLEAQHERFQAECSARGWTAAAWVVESRSAARERPKLEEAMLLARELQGALIVRRLDRVSRTLGELAALMGRAEREGWALVVLDPPVDLTTPMGRAMAGMAEVFAQLERELIGQRTREAIAARRAAGTWRGLERPQCRPYDGPGVPRIVAMHGRGLGVREIARRLTLEGVPGPRGGAWGHSMVRSVLRRRKLSS